MTTANDLKAQAAAAREDARLAKERADAIAAAARKAEREERQAAERKTSEEHYAAMREVGEYYGLSDAQHGIVYAQAYEDDHSSGYNAVEERYNGLAEMARKLLDAN